MNIFKFLPINTFELDQLSKVLLEDVAPTKGVELLLILLDIVAAVVLAGTVTWTALEARTTNINPEYKPPRI